MQDFEKMGIRPVDHSVPATAYALNLVKAQGALEVLYTLQDNIAEEMLLKQDGYDVCMERRIASRIKELKAFLGIPKHHRH